MNRRDFLKTSAAATAAVATGTVLAPKAFAAANPTYTRPLHFMYPQLLSNGETYATLTAALNEIVGVTPGITFLSPLFLNVTDYSSYSNIISYCASKGILFGPAVGQPAAGNTLCDGTGPNMTCLRAIAAENFPGNYLRIDNLSGYYQNSGGQADILQFLRNAISLGFKKIMLNPWPMAKNGTYMQITETDIIPYIDSCFQNAGYQTYQVIDADIQNILSQAAQWAQGTPQILINYESPGPQQTIAGMTFANQKSTFQTTETSIKSYSPSDHLHFALPFTGSYDPLAPYAKNSSGTTMWDYYMVPTIESWQG